MHCTGQCTAHVPFGKARAPLEREAEAAALEADLLIVKVPGDGGRGVAGHLAAQRHPGPLLQGLLGEGVVEHWWQRA